MNVFRQLTSKNIRLMRLQKKMTQQQLADKLGVERQYIYKLENEKVNIGLDYLEKLRVIFGCKPTDFLNEPESNHPHHINNERLYENN